MKYYYNDEGDLISEIPPIGITGDPTYLYMFKIYEHKDLRLLKMHTKVEADIVQIKDTPDPCVIEFPTEIRNEHMIYNNGKIVRPRYVLVEFDSILNLVIVLDLLQILMVHIDYSGGQLDLNTIPVYGKGNKATSDCVLAVTKFVLGFYTHRTLCRQLDVDLHPGFIKCFGRKPCYEVKVA